MEAGSAQSKVTGELAMSMTSESGLLWDQINQSLRIPEDFWIATDHAIVQEDTGDFVKIHQYSDKYTG